MSGPGRPRHHEELIKVRLTLTDAQITYGKNLPGGLSALVRDLIDARREEAPTAEEVRRVLDTALPMLLESDETLAEVCADVSSGSSTWVEKIAAAIQQSSSSRRR